MLLPISDSVREMVTSEQLLHTQSDPSSGLSACVTSTLLLPTKPSPWLPSFTLFRDRELRWFNSVNLNPLHFFLSSKWLWFLQIKPLRQRSFLLLQPPSLLNFAFYLDNSIYLLDSFLASIHTIIVNSTSPKGNFGLLKTLKSFSLFSEPQTNVQVWHLTSHHPPKSGPSLLIPTCVILMSDS